MYQIKDNEFENNDPLLKHKQLPKAIVKNAEKKHPETDVRKKKHFRKLNILKSSTLRFYKIRRILNCTEICQAKLDLLFIPFSLEQVYCTELYSPNLLFSATISR